MAVHQASTTAAELLANDGVTWKFIPVASPHIGGLWEAGVKSVKKHMKRVLDETKLTYEEFSTLLCQIEACLNSRPLQALSNDPEDLTVLTPGHFLITRPLVAPPEPAILDANPTKRWDLLTKLHQDFWHRWSTEYLHQLQQRTKWKTQQKSPAIGDLVLLKERHLPPTKWPLARITELHKGNDGLVRLASIRTKGDHRSKHPLVNLSPLPLAEADHPVNSASVLLSCTEDEQRRSPIVLLPTAIVKVTGAVHGTFQVKTLIDPGSHVNLISEDLVEILRPEMRDTDEIVYRRHSSHQESQTDCISPPSSRRACNDVRRIGRAHDITQST